MTPALAETLRKVKTFTQLQKLLREKLHWPIQDMDIEDLTFEYLPEELGLKARDAAKVEEIRQLRSMDGEPFGIFFIRFQRKKMPVTVMRRILRELSVRKRQSANPAERMAWDQHDLIFVSQWGEDERRHISFVHFQEPEEEGRLASIRVLGWDDDDTDLRIDHVATTLEEKLRWRASGEDDDAWRQRWVEAFEEKYGATIKSTKELSVALARLARRTRCHINTLLAYEHSKGPLTKLMGTFKDALVHDLDKDGFADMYAQTVAYGLLAAWLTGTESNRLQVPMTTPFLRELLETFMQGGGGDVGHAIDFDELGVSDVQRLFERSERRRILENFNDRKPEEDPVIHFYEVFLHEYDHQQKMSRGVFYTPRPVVSFIVHSVDELLRTEFGLEDGLADTTTWSEMAERINDLEIPEGAIPDQAFVRILDPATGTGTFLVEVIELVHRTMTAKWTKEGRLELQEQPALWNEYVEEHLLPRLFGYELMMAPYAIAHLKIGLTLLQTGYDFGGDSRVGVYLTNALEPATKIDEDLPLFSPALAHEAEAVNAIKRDQRFTVVIGNPPYANKGMLNKNPWILRLIDDYKTNLKEKKLNLDDDFIKFIRLSQHIVDRSDVGILSMITNNVFLDGLTHRRMRESILGTFNSLAVLNLHGDTRKRESSPDGIADKNVFDIQQGVAISSLTKRPGSRACFRYGDLWGSRESKMANLSNGATAISNEVLRIPDAPHFLLLPRDLSAQEEYEYGWRTQDIFTVMGKGVKTERDRVSIHFTQEAIRRTVQDFNTKDDESIRCEYALPKDSRDWKVLSAKRDVLQNDADERYMRILYRPFDLRYTWYSGQTRGFIGTPGYPSMRHMLRDNLAMLLTRQVTSLPYNHCFATRNITEIKCASHDRACDITPLFVYDDDPSNNETLVRPNFTHEFLAALGRAVELPTTREHGLPEGVNPHEIFSYIYAVFHSPCYRLRYAELLRSDFPRLPLPGGLTLFRKLADLGTELFSLHLLESPQVANAQLDSNKSLSIIVEKITHSEETVWIDKAKTRGFKGVPEEVWNFHIGGYQVCQKWLKDRQAKGGKNPRPGRVLTDEDIEHYQKIVVALSETIRIMAEIDEVIEAHGGWPDAFVTNRAGDENEA